MAENTKPVLAPKPVLSPKPGSNATESGGAEMTKEEMVAKFKGVTGKTVPEQARLFLREFVGEFAGNFEEILELAEEFLEVAGGPRDTVQELDEQKAHNWLEKRGETMTVKEMRDALREIDLDLNKRVAFIEYLMFKYKKTLTQLFEEKENTNAALLKKLDEAIDLHEEVLAKRAEEADKEAELLKLSTEGTGVKAMKAKAELSQMQARRKTGQNMAEIRAAALKRRAQKALENNDPVADEMKRLALEKAKKDEEEAATKAASKQRLADRAAQFGN